jgi:hypothetical protein
MGAPAKVIKTIQGEAFIEVGDSYVRIGVGDQTFLVMDQDTLTVGGKNFNYQMEPSKVTYQGFLAQQGSVPGLFPGLPNYKLNLQVVKALVVAMTNMTSVATAVGI